MQIAVRLTMSIPQATSATGTRQGDPLFVYLFILYLETLFIQILEDDNVNGIAVSDRLNLLDNLNSVNDVLKIWRFRGFSLSGKIIIFNSSSIQATFIHVG